MFSLSAGSAMEMLKFGAALLGVVCADRLKKLYEKVELVKNTWQLCSELSGYYSHLEEKKRALQKKIEALTSREKDISTELVSSELRSGNKRKREVESWLSNVERKKNDVQCINQRFGEKKDWFCSRLRDDIIKSIEEVEELLSQGDFSNGLLLGAHSNVGVALLQGKNAAQTYSGSVLELLANDEVLSVCVYGFVGVGKTDILVRVHNHILEGKNMFGQVYFITASQDYSIHKMQDDIAKEVGVDLSEEGDERKRAARLFQVLTTKGRSVLIIDNLWEHFDLKDVGIPNQINGCKLIIGTRSFDVCRMMGCHGTVKVDRLPEEEAEKLFMDTLGCRNCLSEEIEAIAKLIIRECEGLPLGITKLANKMRGVDDINIWRNTLNEVTECRGSGNTSYLYD